MQLPVMMFASGHLWFLLLLETVLERNGRFFVVPPRLLLHLNADTGLMPALLTVRSDQVLIGSPASAIYHRD